MGGGRRMKWKRIEKARGKRAAAEKERMKKKRWDNEGIW